MNMKRILALLLCAVMLLPVFGCAGETGEITSGSGSGSDNAASGLAEAWVNEQIEANTLFSFEYDGQAFQEFIGGEVRYTSLALKDAEKAARLQAQAAENAKERYDYLQKLQVLYGDN